MNEATQEYKVRVDNQVTELKTILAQDNIIIDHTEIERAFKFPHFEWNETNLTDPNGYP